MRRLVRGSTLLLAGRLISKVANFATQVLIVRYLSQSSYGAFAYALSVVVLAQSLITLGLDRAIVRFLPIYHEQGDHRRLLGTIAMTLLVICSLGLGAVLVLFGLQGLVGQWMKDDQALALLLILIVLAPLQALDDLLVGIFAVFAKPRAIFFRRYVLAPGLKVAVVIALILSRSNVLFLAFGYIAATLVGLGIYGYLLVHVLREQQVPAPRSLGDLIMPWRQVFGFSLPLLTSDLVYATMTTINVLLLGHFWGTTAVASLRAVQPTAKLNELVMTSFATLFTPQAARMFARNDRAGINGLYWQTAIWIAIFTFPIFATTFALAEPITVLLYGTRYRESASILALLALGYYFNAALGFNGLTLKVWGKVRYIVIISVAAVTLNVVTSFLLIPRFGALGAGIGIMVALVAHNILKQAGLRLGTGISLFEWKYTRVYLAIAGGAVALLAIQITTGALIYLSLGLTAVATLVLIRAHAQLLEIGEMFPEVVRVGLRMMGAGRWRRGEALAKDGETEAGC